MRMFLESVGIKKSERQIEKLLGTNKVRGTWHRDFSRLAERYKLNHVTKRNSSIEMMKYYHKKGYTLIVSYFNKKENDGHYAILRKIDKEYIYFYDPLSGPDHKYKLTTFKNIWYSDPKGDNEKRWFFAVMDSNGK